MVDNPKKKEKKAVITTTTITKAQTKITPKPICLPTHANVDCLQEMLWAPSTGDSWGQLTENMLLRSRP